MNVEDIVIGEEYRYASQWVKVLTVNGTGKYGDAIIETRFGGRILIDVEYLSPKE